ncbi:hypothetical protein ACIBJE_02170 [Micromonospora sp. NPDC050187]|uniref:hypothetical protein n=1 Tax=Micromonospora sp. NPDC050187 TaxID=3364277 RepID=UPI003790CA79
MPTRVRTVHNGPARNRPKGTAQSPAATADPTRCCCAGGPVTIGTFRAQRLVDVERRHLRSRGCVRPSEHVEPRDYQADLLTRRR